MTLGELNELKDECLKYIIQDFDINQIFKNNTAPQMVKKLNVFLFKKQTEGMIISYQVLEPRVNMPDAYSPLTKSAARQSPQCSTTRPP